MASEMPRERTTFRIAKPLKDKLEQLSHATRRTQTELVEEALTAYCDLQAWQLAAVEEGIRDDEAGRLHTTEEVIAMLERLKGA